MARTEENLTQKRLKEEMVVAKMIEIYCHDLHQDAVGNKAVQYYGSDRHGVRLCPECKELADYSVSRSEHCPRMAEKTFCASCSIHCYKPEYREKVRKVMRHAGPRMLFHYPGLALWHLLVSLKEKMRSKKGTTK